MTNQQIATWGGAVLLVLILLAVTLSGDNDTPEEEVAAVTASETSTADAGAEPEATDTDGEAGSDGSGATAEVEAEAAAEEAPAETEAEAEEAPAETAEAEGEPAPDTAETTDAAADSETEEVVENAGESGTATDSDTQPEPTDTAEAASDGDGQTAEAEAGETSEEATTPPVEPAARAVDEGEGDSDEASESEEPETTEAPSSPAATEPTETAQADDGEGDSTEATQSEQTDTAKSPSSPAATEPTETAQVDEGEGDTADSEPAEAEEAAGAEGDTAASGDATGITTGQTQRFADGAVSVFLSQIDREADRVRVAVNGTGRAWLDGDNPVAVEGTDCRLTLQGIEDSAANLSVECGADEDTGTAVGDGTGVGQTALLADGAVRAFVSRLDPQEGRASVSVNGNDRQWLDKGKMVKIDDTGCSIRLDRVDARSAEMSANCHEPSGAAAATATPTDSDTVESLAAGESTALADGTLRLFLSSVDAEGDRARVTVNGFAPRWLTRGRPLRIRETGCRVMLDRIDGRRAGFSADCAARQAAENEETATLAPGEAASFANDTVRIFLSRVDPEAEAARIAVNGSNAAWLSMDEPMDAEGTGCRIELTGLEGRTGTLAVACAGGGDAKTADSSGSDGAASGGGEVDAMLRAGQTKVVEGLRVFVSSVDAEGNRARVAVNGQDRVWLGSGETLETEDGCTISIQKIDGRTVGLAADCG